MSSGFSEASASSTFSLRLLFQVVTATAVFFGVFRVFPELAIAVGMLVTPAFIRTTWAAEQYRLTRRAFPFAERIRCFFSSMLLVMFAVMAGMASFALVSMLFGFLALLLGSAIGLGDMGFDTAVVGTAGGMVWGMAAAILVVYFVLYVLWPLPCQNTPPVSPALPATADQITADHIVGPK